MCVPPVSKNPSSPHDAGIKQFLASEYTIYWIFKLADWVKYHASWFGSQQGFLPHVHSPVILHINTGHIFPIPCTNSTWFCGRSYPFWQLPDYLTYFSSKALAQAKPSQSQAKASAYGLAWHIGKPKPPQAKPKPVASRPSQARTTLVGSGMSSRAPKHVAPPTHLIPINRVPEYTI